MSRAAQPAGAGAGDLAQRLVGLDALRGLSAVAVLVCHLGAYWGFLNLPGKGLQLTQIGAHGVDVFVVLSGFCLALPLVDRRRRLNVAPFLGRRALRILPAYWVALAIAAALAIHPTTWPLVVGAPADALAIAVHVPGAQTIASDVLGSINGSLWSVSLEILLYLTFPGAIWVWRRWGKGALLGLALTVAVGWWLTPDWVSLPFPFSSLSGDGHSLPARFLQFAFGIAAVDWIHERRLPTGRRGAVAAILAVALATLGTTLEVPQWLDALAWAGAGVVCVGAVTGPWFSHAAREVLDAFGLRTFSFYLLHQPVVLLAAPLVAALPGGWAAQLVVGGTAVLLAVSAVAEALFRIVELPSHRLGKRLFPAVVVRSLSARSRAVRA